MRIGYPKYTIDNKCNVKIVSHLVSRSQLKYVKWSLVGYHLTKRFYVALGIYVVIQYLPLYICEFHRMISIDWISYGVTQPIGDHLEVCCRFENRKNLIIVLKFGFITILQHWQNSTLQIFLM